MDGNLWIIPIVNKVRIISYILSNVHTLVRHLQLEDNMYLSPYSIYILSNIFQIVLKRVQFCKRSTTQSIFALMCREVNLKIYHDWNASFSAVD